MTRNVLAIDLAIAIMLAVLVLIISPGAAVTGIIALAVVLGCVISFVVDARRGKRRAARGPRRR